MKTVITYGVFDLFHEGHVNLLKRAKALGDKLIVGVTSDAFTRQRGKLLLADRLEVRAANVRNCPYVDEVILEDHFGQKIEDIQRYHVDVFVIGDDWKGRFDYLKKWCEVVYLPRTPGISSSSLRNAPYPQIRFGIIGNGRIVPRFLKELQTVRGGLKAIGVYNPHLDSAKAFAADHPELQAYADLEEMLMDSDAVYIASPHPSHNAYIRQALLAGKHVLCEKPLGLSKAETREVFALAKEKKLVLMEAIKTAYCPGFRQMMGLVQSGFIGKVQDVESCFTKLTARPAREWELPYGGSFTELGSYTLLPIIRLLGTKDLQISFASLFDEEGTDTYTKAIIRKDDILALSKTGLGVKAEGELIISGTEGYVLVKAPWWKTAHFEIHREDPRATEYFDCEFKGDGLRYEIAEFVERIQGWHDSDELLSAEESICLAGIFERFLDWRKEQQ